MANLNVRVSGQAEFSAIKREVRDLDSNLKKLGDTARKASGQGFMSNVQKRETKFLVDMLNAGQDNVNNLLNEERTKIGEILNKLQNANVIQKRALNDELNQRKAIVKTYEDQLAAIKRQQQMLQDMTGDMPTKNVGGSSGGGGLFSMLKNGPGKLLGITAGLMGIGSILGFIQQSYEMAKQVNIMGAKLGMRLPQGPNGTLSSMMGTGAKLGYDATESMQIADVYSSTGGKMTNRDLQGVMGLARAFGLEGGEVAGNMGQMRRLGVGSVGQMTEFAEMISSAIDQGNMQERAAEAMEATVKLLTEIGDKLPEVNGRNVLAYQTLLNQTGVSGFQGDRGADVLSKLNQMITSNGSGDSSFFIMRALGWGQGKDYYDTRLQAEQGLDNNQNLYSVLNYISGIKDTKLQDMALSQLSGLSITQAKTLRESTGNFQDLSPQKLDEIKAQLKETDGKQKTMQDRMQEFQDSVGGGLNQLDTDWKNMQLQIGNDFIPIVTEFKDKAIDVLGKIHEFTSQISTFLKEHDVYGFFKDFTKNMVDWISKTFNMETPDFVKKFFGIDQPKDSSNGIAGTWNKVTGAVKNFFDPFNGYNVTSPYGARQNPISGAFENHTGVDLGIPQSTLLRAVRSGTVVSAGPEGGYGNRVRIKLDTGEEIGYAHMSEIGVKAGDVLEAGDVIGRSGGKPGTPGAGSSTGSHLHFSVQNAEGMMIDPMPWLKNGGIEPSRLGMMGIGGGEPLPSKTVTLNVNVKVDSTNLSDASEDEIKGAVLEAIKTDEIRKILANPVLVN